MTVTFDMLLEDQTGDMPLVPILGNGIEKIAQSVGIAVGLHRGEVLFNKNDGIPYQEIGQQKPLRTDQVSDFIKAKVSVVEGVVRITEWTPLYVQSLRKFSITGRVVVVNEREFEFSVLPVGNLQNTNPLAIFTILGTPKIF